MCVRPTHYAISTVSTALLTSLILEGSLDGTNWMEVDRQIEKKLSGWFLDSDSIPISNSGEFRFIRITQTGNNSARNGCLAIQRFELFGTLAEF
jgi:hypothetical protein